MMLTIHKTHFFFLLKTHIHTKLSIVCFQFCNHIIEMWYKIIFTLWVLKIHFFTTHGPQSSYHFENQYLNVATKWLRMLLKGMPKKTDAVYYETAKEDRCGLLWDWDLSLECKEMPKKTDVAYYETECYLWSVADATWEKL